YWRHISQFDPLPRLKKDAFAAAVQAVSSRLQQQRRIRELRRPPLPNAQQNLIWLDGERLCVTSQFLEEAGCGGPAWVGQGLRANIHQGVYDDPASLPTGRQSVLRRRCRAGFFTARKVRGFEAPEFEQAALLFRLERQGLTAPRVLAVGRTRSWWRQSSFLLT